MISRKLTPFSKDFFGGSLRGNFFLTRHYCTCRSYWDFSNGRIM